MVTWVYKYDGHGVHQGLGRLQCLGHKNVDEKVFLGFSRGRIN